MSYGHLDIVKFLVNTRNFDADVQVRLPLLQSRGECLKDLLYGYAPKFMSYSSNSQFRSSKVDKFEKDGSGWTPLMIAVSLKDGEEMVDLLLKKGADVNQKSELPKTSLRIIYVLTIPMKILPVR